MSSDGQSAGFNLSFDTRSTSEVAVIVCVILTLLLIVGVITYIVWAFMRKDLKGVVLIKNTRSLAGKKPPLTIPSTKLPVTYNGQQYAFSFWVYITNFQATTNHKLLFVRGNSSDLSLCNPVVFMDATTNRLYISLATNRVARGSGSVTMQKIASGALADQFVTGIVEYVPLQRWVHVAFTVEDRLATIFVDGDLYTVASVSDDTSIAASKARPTPRPIIAPLSGDVTVGAWGSSSTVNAYMGRFSFYNYALTPKDVQRIYAVGPVGPNVLGGIGLGEYGVRNPVYRLQDGASDEEDSYH